METTIVSLVSTGMVIIATLTMLITSFNSASNMADSWRNMEQQASEIRRTEITTELPSAYTGGNLVVNVENAGQIDFSQFSEWDVIAERQSGGAYHIEYVDAAPGSNQWTMGGIYLSDNSTSEIFDSGIVNPGEIMKIAINLVPAMSVGETTRLSVTTPNGVTAQLLVTRAAP